MSEQRDPASQLQGSADLKPVSALYARGVSVAEEQLDPAQKYDLFGCLVGKPIIISRHAAYRYTGKMPLQQLRIPQRISKMDHLIGGDRCDQRLRRRDLTVGVGQVCIG